MEIIKSGVKGTIKCHCGCKFKYVKGDISDSGEVTCPECGKSHRVMNEKSYSKTKIL